MPAMNHWMSPLSLRISSLLGILGSVPVFNFLHYFPQGMVAFLPSVTRQHLFNHLHCAASSTCIRACIWRAL